MYTYAYLYIHTRISCVLGGTRVRVGVRVLVVIGVGIEVGIEEMVDLIVLGGLVVGGDNMIQIVKIIIINFLFILIKTMLFISIIVVM